MEHLGLTRLPYTAPAATQTETELLLAHHVGPEMARTCPWTRMMLLRETIDYTTTQADLVEAIGAHAGNKPYAADDDHKAQAEVSRWETEYQMLQASLHVHNDEFHFPIGHPRGLNESPRTLLSVVQAAVFADYDLPDVPQA